MKIKFLFVTLIAFTALSFTNPIADDVKNIDTEASKVAWVGYKLAGKHAGTVNIQSGSLNYSGEALTGGSFVIDMSTLAVTDIEGEWAEKLREHLESDDFFGVSNHPTAKFVITKVENKSKRAYSVTGNLTIKGKTHEISFNADTAPDGVISAKIVVDRTKFGIKYSSGSFFDGLGDKMIYDEFDLNVELVPAK